MLFLSLLFWAFLASFVVHILDESLLNGGFVEWIQANFWPAYHARMFFWFNAAAIAAIAVGNLLFDSLGGHWVILPLVWVAGFVTHLLTVHVYWTLRRNTYSPGLLSSLLYAIVFYVAIRYGLGRGLITGTDFAIGTLVGVTTVGTFLTVAPTLVFPWLAVAIGDRARIASCVSLYARAGEHSRCRSGDEKGVGPDRCGREPRRHRRRYSVHFGHGFSCAR